MLLFLLYFTCSVFLWNCISCEPTNSKLYAFSKEDDLDAITQLNKDVKALELNSRNKICTPINFGKMYGAHKLCNHFSNEHFECYFLSFGIEREYSFDKALSHKRNCKGIGLDPTVDYPNGLAPGVSFIKAGANSPIRTNNWTYVSVPMFRKLHFNHPLFALKMDCEGCEYSLANDILEDDPNFFQYVLQFNIEIHLPLSFATKSADIYGFGRLIRLIYLANMSLVHVDNARCGPKDRDLGCHVLLDKIKYPCDPGCSSLLFSHNYSYLNQWKMNYD